MWLRSPSTAAIVGRPSSGLRAILDSVMHAGRGLLPLNRPSHRKDRPTSLLRELCHQLLDIRGEASGLALANEILTAYQSLSEHDRLDFFRLLSNEFGPDLQAILDAAEAYRDGPGFETLSALADAVEAPRRELFRRLNMVPDGTSRLVRMRGDQLELVGDWPELRAVEADLLHLLTAWFNRGFLVMERIDWSSSAEVLERIIAYEAVHEINGWDDLRSRLASDRRCFAFFHPAMPDDPLIFVQIALTRDIASAVGPLLAKDREIGDARGADTAVFYSISNCHIGLRGISFGHFLIKQVIEELRRDLENIKRFVTLSPVPGLCAWIDDTSLEDLPERLRPDIEAARQLFTTGDRPEPSLLPEEAAAILMRLCAYYLLEAKRGGEPVDPVARFHLGNGASLERINWAGDCSPVGIERSGGIMVNYLYRLADIEKNHELYFARGQIVASNGVRRLALGR
jgi:malonyl-CoA decarboxylase